ncbi:MAG: DUF4190 domain-containing protein [Lachnospiraceae bacterium]|nr:DUF4190 domain-containing protein [Lachnospiraceae bacterium]
MDNNGYNNYGNQGGPMNNGYQGGMPNGNYGYNGGMPQEPKQSSGFAITSLVCGIVSIVCCYCTMGITIIPAIMAIIFGVVAQKKGQSKGLSIAGIICGIVGLLLSAGMLIYIIFVGGVTFLEAFSQYM